MNEMPERPTRERHEVVERREVVEGPAADRRPYVEPAARGARAATVWLWVIPLLAVVIFLVWFILSRGEPQSPLQNLELPERAPATQQTPTVEVPAPVTPESPAAQPVSPPPATPGQD